MKTAATKALRVSASKSVRKPRAVKTAPLAPTPAPAPRVFNVTLTQKDAELLRDFSTLCNTEPGLTLAFLAGQRMDFMEFEEVEQDDWWEFYARRLAEYRALVLNGAEVCA
jgi:hypothetical protein